MKNQEWLSLFWKDIFHKILRDDEDQIAFLKSTTFFKGCSEWEIHLIQEFLHIRSYKMDEHIFELGHPGAALYFVKSGKVAIEIPAQGTQNTLLATLEPGSFFGELALIDDSPRSASARAIVPTVVLALPRSELDRMLKERPNLGGIVYRALATITGTRLKTTLDQMQNTQNELKMVVNG